MRAGQLSVFYTWDAPPHVAGAAYCTWGITTEIHRTNTWRLLPLQCELSSSQTSLEAHITRLWKTQEHSCICSIRKPAFHCTSQLLYWDPTWANHSNNTYLLERRTWKSPLYAEHSSHCDCSKSRKELPSNKLNTCTFLDIYVSWKKKKIKPTKKHLMLSDTRIRSMSIKF